MNLSFFYVSATPAGSIHQAAIDLQRTALDKTALNALDGLTFTEQTPAEI